ncbi:MAG: M60 family metallopeptidase [Prevotella sp.]|nr:M60 family metallopeptidase [Prevotella sp.]
MRKKTMIFACALLFAVAAQAQWSFSTDKYYMLKHVSSGKYLFLHDSYTESNSVNATTLEGEGTPFTITQSGSGYVFTKKDSDKTLSLSTNGGYAGWNTSNKGGTAWTLVDGGDDCVYLQSSKGFLGPDNTSAGSYVYTNKTKGNSTLWQIVDASEALPNYVSSITSGKYYRLVSNTNTGVAMADAGGGLVTSPTERTNYSQVWQLTASNGGYKFKNLLTGKSITSAPGTSAQWRTGSSAATLYTGKSTSSGKTLFWFSTQNNSSAYTALHSAPHQSNNVVAWTGDADASKWLLDMVDETKIDFDAIQDLQTFINTNYTSQLMAFYDDYACTQLKSNYASMSDDELRSAMSGLPAELREEGVRVKNDKWNNNQTWNKYEKDFRIHDFEVYSEPQAWANKLSIGAFSGITQPTGIRLKSGELVFLLVNDNVTDSDGHLYAELVAGVDLRGAQTTLKRGYNAVIASSDCEIFITYNCTNTNKELSRYPDIKIHIVGGTCNGTFDMNRGHTQKDWTWLKNNMLKDTYLHLRSKYHVMNCYLDRVKNADNNLEGALKIWDFVFENLEKLMTTQFNNGKYRPIMLVFDASGNNPNWSSGRVSMPGMYGSAALNYNSLLYSGPDGGQQWVIEHEEGHGHQAPINLSGTTEVSNNGLAQIVNHLWGYRTSRGRAQNATFDYFNEGVQWVDYPRRGDCLWLTNKLWYQLWLYFHVKGDDGFFARWMETLQSMDGGIKKSGGSDISRMSTSRTTNELMGKASTWGSWTSEYMRMALAACEASQTDLYEFFKMWGFFGYADQVHDADDNDIPRNGIFRISDYSHYFVRVPVRGNKIDEDALTWCKDKMQSYEKKAPGIMFINDTGELTQIDADAECVKYDASLAKAKRQYSDDGARQNQGGLGTYTHFGKNEAKDLSFTINGSRIVTRGSGAVGFKIYNDKGELVYVSNRRNFTVNSTILAGIQDGTYSLVASLGDDTDLLLSGPHTDYTNKDVNGVTTINIEPQKADGYYTIDGVKLNNMPTTKGIYIINGRKVVIQ